MTDKIRVRFAPSPTGNLHIGGVRTALFNWLFAKHNEGKFILRIEDTDTERSSKESTFQIIEAMKWLNLNWDEGPEVEGNKKPYFQSQRRNYYRRTVDFLLKNNLAYHCYCTPNEVEEMKNAADKAGKPAIYPGHCRNLSDKKRKKYEEEGRESVIRLKTPTSGNTVIEDLIRGKISFDNSLLGDFIIVKSNGWPTYNFACVVDDYTMNITHVIRADEHLSNTPKQIIAYKALNFDPPQFAHVPMILAPDKSKLSKRHGATSVNEFKQEGFLAEGLLNYLLLLGWSPGNNDEIISLKRAIRDFKLGDVSKNPATYDRKKLAWVNGHYMRKLPLKEIVNRALPFIKETGYIEEPLSTAKKKRLYKIIDAVRERARTLIELVDGISYFYNDDFDFEKKGVNKHFSQDNTVKILENNIDCLQKVNSFKREEIEAIYRQRSKELGVKTARMIHTTRLALSGRTFGPGLFTLVELVGRNKAIKRLKRALKYVKNL